MARTALVVDDSRSIREIMSFTLKQSGFEVVDAANGAEALTKLDTHDVSIIITDYNMPMMDGLTFIKQARTKPKCKFTPILVLTTETDDTKKQAAKTAGATGWLVKPFQPEQLLKVIARVLP